jgi:GTP-binding protein EngB required for normal cell division
MKAGNEYLTFSDDEKSRIYTRVEQIDEKLDEIGRNSLTLGLLGGTGVGKSTLMNALADSEISSTSHRRPHTDAVLLYRHADVAIPLNLKEASISMVEHIHNADAIKQVLLCDLPDYDSILKEHRQAVLDFLDSLDILVWVLSPEKYADGLFFEMLALVPKAWENFYFVLNKSDIFFMEKPADEAHSEMVRVIDTLNHYLREAGIENPVLYHISSLEAQKGQSLSFWNQIPQLRQEIFRRRTFKELREIKASNLDRELEGVFAGIEEEANKLSILESEIEDTRHAVLGQRSDWLKTVEHAAEEWIDTGARPAFTAKMSNPGFLIGPGKLIAHIAGFRRYDTAGSEKTRNAMPNEISSHIGEALGRHLTHVKEKFAANLYRRGFIPPLAERIINIGNPRQCVLEFEHRLELLLREPLESFVTPSFRLFKLQQYIIYFFLVLLCLIALAGEETGRYFFRNPDIMGVVNILAMALFALFSPKGLAALGSLLVLCFFMGYRFYGIYRKKRDKRVDKLIVLLKGDIADYAGEAIDMFISDLEKSHEEVKSNRLSLSGFRH